MIQNFHSQHVEHLDKPIVKHSNQFLLPKIVLWFFAWIFLSLIVFSIGGIAQLEIPLYNPILWSSTPCLITHVSPNATFSSRHWTKSDYHSGYFVKVTVVDLDSVQQQQFTMKGCDHSKTPARAVDCAKLKYSVNQTLTCTYQRSYPSVWFDKEEAKAAALQSFKIEYSVIGIVLLIVPIPAMTVLFLLLAFTDDDGPKAGFSNTYRKLFFRTPIPSELDCGGPVDGIHLIPDKYRSLFYKHYEEGETVVWSEHPSGIKLISLMIQGNKLISIIVASSLLIWLLAFIIILIVFTFHSAWLLIPLVFVLVIGSVFVLPKFGRSYVLTSKKCVIYDQWLFIRSATWAPLIYLDRVEVIPDPVELYGGKIVWGRFQFKTRSSPVAFEYVSQAEHVASLINDYRRRDMATMN